MNDERKKIIIYTWNNISKAYSCLHYLKNQLEKTSTVECWSLTPSECISSPKQNSYYSFYDLKCWKLKGIRHFIIFYNVYKRMIDNPDDIYIINDLKFFHTAYLAKKKNPNIIIIHYNTEIPGKDVKVPYFVRHFYSRFADFPDVIIDCLLERAEWRKNTYNIQKDIYVINNTLPKDVLDNSSDYDVENIIHKAGDRKILLYAGGINKSRNLYEIADCIPLFDNDVFFLFYCYGSDDDLKILKILQDKYEKYNNFMFCKSIDRNDLIKVMKICDIGVNYYDPKFSINHLYSSPSKLFEYMACGMNIISTKNVGVDRIIIGDDLGVCINENESFADALQRLLLKGLKEKEYISNIFSSKYEYSIDSSKALEVISGYLGI